MSHAPIKNRTSLAGYQSNEPRIIYPIAKASRKPSKIIWTSASSYQASHRVAASVGLGMMLGSGLCLACLLLSLI